MTAALRPRRAGLSAFAFVLALVLAPARGATTTECWGNWSFDLAAPTPDKEAWMSPDSWCRGAKLPRKLAAEARLGAAGKALLTASPLRLSDVTIGSGRCEFQFAGPAVSPTKYYELLIDVNASGAVVEGKGRCAERTRVSDEKTNSLVIEVAVTGRHSPAPASDLPPPPSAPGSSAPAADRLATSVVAACKRRDADALWKVMTPRFRSELDARAAEVRVAVPASDLRRLFGHKGRPATFKGLAFLRSRVEGVDAATSPCWGAEQWTPGPAVSTSDGILVPVEGKGDLAFGLRLTRSARGWQLDQITKSAQVPRKP